MDLNSDQKDSTAFSSPFPISNVSSETQPSAILRRTSGPARKSRWKKQEDEILTKAVKQYNGRNWKKVAEFLPGRVDTQCLHRWQKVLNPELIKGTWTKEVQEDDRIIELVGKLGSRKWSVIAKSLPGRIGKQCRERWHNHLNPTLKKDAWTTEEEEILIHAQKHYRNRWAEIAKLLPGRADNSIKNHWNCSLKKRLDRQKNEILSSQIPGVKAECPKPDSQPRIFALDLNKDILDGEHLTPDSAKDNLNNLTSPDQKILHDKHLTTSDKNLVHQNASQGTLHLDLVNPISKEDAAMITTVDSPIHCGDLSMHASAPSSLSGICNVDLISTENPCQMTNSSHDDYSDHAAKSDNIHCSQVSTPQSKACSYGCKRSGSQVHLDTPSIEGIVESLPRLQEQAFDGNYFSTRNMSEKLGDATISRLLAGDLTDTDGVGDLNQVPVTPPHCDNENFGPLYYIPPQMQMMDKEGLLSSENLLMSEGYKSVAGNTVHCSTLPNLSLSIARLPTSPDTILRSAANRLKSTPYSLRKRGCDSNEPLVVEDHQREAADTKNSAGIGDNLVRAENLKDVMESEYVHQYESNGQVDFIRTDILNDDPYFRTSYHLRQKILGAIKSLEERLEDGNDGLSLGEL